MKIANLILTGLFLLFAVVQYNDPDPWVWIAAYLSVALLFILHSAGKLPRVFLLISFLLFTVWGLTYIPDFINWLNMGAPSVTGQMKATEPHIELVREFGGLVICLAGIGFLLWQKRKV